MAKIRPIVDAKKAEIVKLMKEFDKEKLSFVNTKPKTKLAALVGQVQIPMSYFKPFKPVHLDINLDTSAITQHLEQNLEMNHDL